MREITFSVFILALFTGFALAQTDDLCACPKIDIVCLIDRAYFGNVRYGTVVRPMLTEIADNLTSCADIRVAFVDFGASTKLRSTMDQHIPSDVAKQAMRDYRVGDYLGDFSLLGEALYVTRTQVCVFLF